MGSQVSANHNIYTRFSVANCLINCSQSHPPAPARVFVVPCPTTGPPGKEIGERRRRIIKTLVTAMAGAISDA